MRGFPPLKVLGVRGEGSEVGKDRLEMADDRGQRAVKLSYGFAIIRLLAFAVNCCKR